MQGVKGGRATGGATPVAITTLLRAAARRVFTGSCSCGKSSVRAHGDSILDFYTHSSGPRHCTGEPYTAMSGWRREDVVFSGEVICRIS